MRLVQFKQLHLRFPTILLFLNRVTENYFKKNCVFIIGTKLLLFYKFISYISYIMVFKEQYF